MDGTSAGRARGFKINGASHRPGSRNKQWLAPGQEVHHLNGNDSERWERGGGPRRAVGRGRGRARGPTPVSGHSTPHLTVPVSREEPTSGTEDEGMTDAEEFENEDTAIDEPELETHEEREKFYQELVKAREVERKKAIAEGKMDDPLVPKRLDEAITMVGTCMDMCPRFERYRRERENNLDKWEVIPGTKRVDHKRAVKIYERAAGDKTLPSDLRPPHILKKTLNYLFHDLIARGGFSQTYGFIRDRSRAVRSDFTMQHETGALAMECHDRCARFHILALHLERDNRAFSVALEEQQLMNTLQSLKEFYEDQRGRYSSPTELEMRVYHRLIHIRDQKERHEEIPEDIASHEVFQLTTAFRLHVQAKSAPISKTSRLLVDAQGLEIFSRLAAVLQAQNNAVMVYLVACIMERLFGKDTIEHIESLRGDLSYSEIIDGVSSSHVPAIIDHTPEKPLTNGAPSVQPLAPPSSFVPQTSPSAFPSAAQTVAPSSTPSTALSPFMIPQAIPPVKSAFSTLVSTPNAFGPVTSVFGGAVFGSSAPSTAPKPVSGFSAFTPNAPTSASAAPLPSQPVTSNGRETPYIFGRHSSSSQPHAASTDYNSSVTGPLFGNPLAAEPDSLIPGETPQKTFNGSRIPPPSFTPPKPLNPFASSFQPSPPRPTFQTPPGPSAAGPSLPVTPPTQPSFHPSSAAPQPLTPAPTLPATVFSTPPASVTDNRTPSVSQPEPQFVERKQTLWDLPSTTPASLANISSLSPQKSPFSAVPPSPLRVDPPPLNKPKPLALPPTPTARWFDPSSQPKSAGASLAMRKQSLGLIGLQMPDHPSPAEILSPLALPTPQKTIPPPVDDSSPTPQSRTAEPVASTSRMLLEEIQPRSSSKGKEKEEIEELEPDPKILAREFARRGSIVRACFKRWKDKTIEHAVWVEACLRGDAYKKKVQRHRLSSSTSSLPGRIPKESEKKRRLSGHSSSEASRRARRRTSGQYKPPISDSELAKRLQENHEEYQRRWAQGSFLHAIRSAVNDASDGKCPSEWRVWLSMNTENDGTAIWLERKFDVPESGEWISDGIFSVSMLPESRGTPNSCPGLIVFERTPADDLDDVLEKKYRVLDDCSRLRDVATQLGTISQLRFTPALLVLTWADTDGPDAAPDFGDMITEMIQSKIIGSVQNVVLSSKSQDWDSKFLNALALTDLDLADHTLVTMAWDDLCNLYISPFKTHASDWLDSCWTDDEFDWSRYGDVLRAIEELQIVLAKEILRLLDRPTDIVIRSLSDLQTPSHLGPDYATGPFLDACLRNPVKQVEQLLGDVHAEYSIGLDQINESRERFEQKVHETNEHLRQLAATSLSSRVIQKRRVYDGSDGDSPPSTRKRLKLSASASGSDEYVETDNEISEDPTPPPLSVAPSTVGFNEAAPKPSVTIAMLRALAQGVLKSSK